MMACWVSGEENEGNEMGKGGEPSKESRVNQLSPHAIISSLVDIEKHLVIPS